MPAQLTHEEVVRVRVRPANAEKLHQIMKLAVYISAHCNWTFLGRVSVCNDGAKSILAKVNLTTGCTFDSSCRTSRAYMADDISAPCP